jgi:DNA-binding transcriptional ArsR family regulator
MTSDTLNHGLQATPQPTSGASCEVTVVHPEAVRHVQAVLPDAALMQRVSMSFQILSDPTRARIVYALSLEELCVCDVAVVAGLSMSAASHQLKRLRDQGIVSFRKEGRMAFYRLRDPHIRKLLDTGIGRVQTEVAP